MEENPGWFGVAVGAKFWKRLAPGAAFGLFGVGRIGGGAGRPLGAPVAGTAPLRGRDAVAGRVGLFIIVKV